jgi:hypothetical protein
MNVLCLTQANALALFHSLMQRLQPPLGLGRVGYFVADRRFYEQYCLRHPDLEPSAAAILKEWEIVHRAQVGRPNLERLHAYERQLGSPTLWAPLVADRRLYLGPLCTLRQDYRSRFDHERMLRVLEEGLIAVERLFDEVKPEAVFSFICVTFGEYLGYLFARARGIPVLNLRPTRIQNYVTFAPTIFEPSETIRAAYAREADLATDDGLRAEARQFVAAARAGPSKYEGVVPVSRKPPAIKPLRRQLLPRLHQFARDEYAFHFGSLRGDNHLVDPLQVMLHRRLLTPARAWRIHRALQHRYVQPADLPALDYAFFPLHTEPEISLLVHSRFYLNQIEAIRGFSQSLPVSWTLVVKEHPASVGKRPMGYYRKLLQIPNVRLADPGLTSRPLIERARLVVTIAGTIGFEAALAGKPVITLGDTPYELLPSTMVRRVTALPHLPAAVHDLLHAYHYDEQALVSFAAATLRHSTRCNLYSGLLGREGVYSPQAESAEEASDLEQLAQLAVTTLAQRAMSVSASPLVGAGEAPLLPDRAPTV